MSLLRLVFYECIYFTNLKNRMYQFILFFQPIIYLLIVKYMLMLRDGGQEDKYILAVGIMSAWSYVLYSSGSSLVAEKWMGTLEMVMNTKTSIFQIILSKTINNALIGAISIFNTLIYARFLFQFKLSFISSWVFWFALLGLMISLICIGMILAIIFSLFQNVYAYQNLILFPILIISGIFYPLELMPTAVQWIGGLLPMGWMVKGLYYSVEQYQIQYVYLGMGYLICLLYLALAVALLKRMSQKMKETSVMGVF